MCLGSVATLAGLAYCAVGAKTFRSCGAKPRRWGALEPCAFAAPFARWQIQRNLGGFALAAARFKNLARQSGKHTVFGGARGNLFRGYDRQRSSKNPLGVG